MFFSVVIYDIANAVKKKITYINIFCPIKNGILKTHANPVSKDYLFASFFKEYSSIILTEYIITVTLFYKNKNVPNTGLQVIPESEIPIFHTHTQESL